MFPSHDDKLQLFPLSIYAHYVTANSAVADPESGSGSATSSNSHVNSLNSSDGSAHQDSTSSAQYTQNDSDLPNSTSNTNIASESSSHLVISLLAASKTCLHLWNLPTLSSRENGAPSLSIDLQPFHPSLSIEDVSFLSGFDRTGEIVGVAGAEGVVMVVNSRKHELIWKVFSSAARDS